jgi:hypothetical protein
MPTPGLSNKNFVRPSADYGTGEAFVSGIREGLQTNIGGQLQRAGRYFMLDTMSYSRISKEDFDSTYSLGGRLKWSDGMSRERSKAMRDDYLSDELNRSKMGSSDTASTVGNLIGGMLHPVDLLIGFYTPPAKLLSMGVSRAGSAGARFVSRTVNQAASGMMEAAVTSPVLIPLADYNQGAYSWEDYLVDITASTFLGGLVGAGHGTLRHVSRTALDEAQDAAMHGAFNGDSDISKSAKAALAKDPRVAAEATLVSKINEKLTGKEPLTDADAELIHQAYTPEVLVHPEVEAYFMPGGPKVDRGLNPGDDWWKSQQARMEGKGPSDEWWAKNKQRADENQRAAPEIDDRIKDAAVKMSVEEGAPTELVPSKERQPAPGRDSQVAREARAKYAEDNSYEAKSDDERLITDIFDKLFGTKVRYFNESVSKKTGVLGLSRPSDPTKIYIRTGAADAGPASMLNIAGHELGHSIRSRAPKLWITMVDVMMKSHDENGNPDPVIKQAYREVAALANEGRFSSVWTGLDGKGKIDEIFATILGKSMERPTFWRTLHQTSPFEFARLRETVNALAGRAKVLKNKPANSLSGKLAEIINMIDSQGFHISERVLPVKAYPDYSARHLDYYAFLQQRVDIDPTRSNEHAKSLEALDRIIDEISPSVHGIVSNDVTVIRPLPPNLMQEPRLWVGKQLLRDYKEIREMADKAEAHYKKTGRESSRKLAKTLRAQSDNIRKLFGKDGERAKMYTIHTDKDGKRFVHFYFDTTYTRWTEKTNLYDKSDNSPERRRFKFENRLHRDPKGEGIGGIEVANARESITARDEAFKELAAIEKDTVKAAQDLEDAEIELKDTSIRDDVTPAKLEEAKKFVKMQKAELEDLEIHSEQLRSAIQEYWPNKDTLNRLFDEDEQLAGDVEATKRGAEKAWETTDVRNPSEWTLNNAHLRDDGAASAAQELFDRVRADLTAELEETLNVAHTLDGNSVEGVTTYLDDTTKDLLNYKLKDASPEDYASVQKFLDERTKEIIEDINPGYSRLLGLTPTKAEAELKAGMWKSLKQLEFLPPEQLMVSDPDVNFMARADGESDIDFQSRLDELIEEGKNAVNRRVTQASASSKARLQREHGTMGRWVTNLPEALRAKLAEESAEIGVEFDPTFEKPRTNATEAEEVPLKGRAAKLQTSLNEQYAKTRAELSLIESARIAGKPLDPANEPGFTYDYYHDVRGMRGKELYDTVKQDRILAGQVASNALFLNSRAKAGLFARTKLGLNHLYSYLDGRARKGVANSGDSVSARIHELLDSDLAPVAALMQELGISPRVWAENGELVRQTVLELNGVKTGNVAAREMAEILHLANNTGTGRLNSLGAGIRNLEWFAFSQVHNRNLILGVSKDEFISDVMGWLDWERTYPNLDTPAKRIKYLEAIHHESTRVDGGQSSMDLDPETMGGNIANQVSRHRTMHFLPGKAFDYDMKYGSGNTGNLIFQQLTKRAERAAIMEAFGTDYKKTWKSVMKRIAPSRDMEAVALERLFKKAERIDMTFQHLTGNLDHPTDLKIAAIGQGVRNFANMVVGWMSGVSSLTDYSHAISQARFMGIPAEGLHKAYVKSLKDHVKRNGKDSTFLQAQGAGLQALIYSFGRATDSNGTFSRMLKNGSDAVFRLNGQQEWTRVAQSAFSDISSQHFGKMAQMDKLPPEFVNWLRTYNITEIQFREMGKHAAEVEGLEGVRLAPDMVEDVELGHKLRLALRDSMDYAVLVPSVSDEALLRMGLKSGEWGGEAMRTAMQYKSYVLAIVRKVNSRFDHAYGADLWASDGYLTRASKERLSWSMGILGMAALVISIKDVMRGREPLNPLNPEQWNLANMGRVFAQAGIGPMAVLEQFGSIQQAIGPAGGLAYNAISKVATGTPYQATNAVFGLLPGASIAPLSEARKALMGGLMPETLGVGFQSSLTMIELERRQSSGYKK